MKIEIHQKILSDAPYSENNSGLFIDVEQGDSDFLQDLLKGGPTCYLVSGYRGAGKTSFIKKIETRIKDLQKQQEKGRLIFIYLNFSKNESHGHLFRKLIRGLFFQFAENQIEVPPLLATLHEKTFYETSKTTNTTTKTEKSTDATIDVMSLLQLLIGPFLIIFFINIWYLNPLQASQLISAIGILFGLWQTIAKFMKFSQGWSRKRTNQESADIKTLYDDEIADHHFTTILKTLKEKYNIVFVFDEMDKIENEDIDNLLKEMKPYLVSGLASFIVVAGQSLYYKYFISNIEDDALLSTIFSKSIHIPLLSREQFLLIIKDRLIVQTQPLSSSEEQLLKSYTDYLIFESNRIPRKFIHEIRKAIVWEDEKAILIIDNSQDELSQFTKAITAIEEIEDVEISSIGFEPALQDLFVMQLYIRSHEIFFSRKNTFTIDDLKKANPEDVRTRWKFYSDRFLVLLLEGFEKHKIIEKLSDNLTYRLTGSVLSGGDFRPADTEQNSFVTQLTELRSIANNISGVLFQPNSNERQTFSKMLLKLEQSKALTMNWKKRNELLKMLDDLDTLITEPGGIQDIQAIINEEDINLNKITHGLFDYFGAKQARDYFASIGYQQTNKPIEKIDLLLKNSNNSVKQIAFEFKFRRVRAVPDKRLLLQSLTHLSETTLLTSMNTYLIIIVFTYDKPSTFNRALTQFTKNIQEIEEFVDLKHKVFFIPVSTTGVHILQNSFSDFAKNYIKDEFTFTFKSQTPPIQHPERNDHFLEKVFEFKKWDFTIILDPKNYKYWRFGFTFSKLATLPGIDEPRHNDTETADIHLCAGNPIDGDITKWSNAEHLLIANYHIKAVEDTYRERHDYNGQRITFRLFTASPEFNTHLEVITGDESRGGAVYNLRQYEYCVLSAWCDGQKFELETQIKIVYNEPSISINNNIINTE